LERRGQRVPGSTGRRAGTAEFAERAFPRHPCPRSVAMARSSPVPHCSMLCCACASSSCSAGPSGWRARYLCNSAILCSSFPILAATRSRRAMVSGLPPQIGEFAPLTGSRRAAWRRTQIAWPRPDRRQWPCKAARSQIVRRNARPGDPWKSSVPLFPPGTREGVQTPPGRCARNQALNEGIGLGRAGKVRQCRGPPGISLVAGMSANRGVDVFQKSPSKIPSRVSAANPCQARNSPPFGESSCLARICPFAKSRRVCPAIFIPIVARERAPY